MKRLQLLFLFVFSFLPLFQVYGEETHYSAIIKIESEDDVNDLLSQGVEILRRRDNLLLCFVPLNTTEKKETRGTKRCLIPPKSRKAIPTMDRAREFFNAEAMHAGTDLPHPYTGKNVVAGICDTGFDPLHINFYDAEGNNRVRRIIQYKESAGERIVVESEDSYRNWITDNDVQSHATHVAGIMGGSCTETGYQGMAPGADLVITTSELTDVGLLCGAEDILDYAREQGKPAVINMSMANYLGPHDGSGLFSQYLDKIGEEAIVVMSSGNAGDYTGGIHYTFTTERPELRFNLSNHYWTQFDMYGATQCWSGDNSPLRVRLCIYDGNIKENIFFFPWQTLRKGEQFMVSSEGETSDDIEYAKYFDGIFTLEGGIDAENGRYNVTAQYDAKTGIESSGGPWARYLMSLEIEGEPGKDVFVYSDNRYTRLTTFPGYPAPNSSLSFSDLSSGFNLVSVGMYVNRLSSEDDPATAIPPGTVSPYSSYGTLPDGRVMPHTVAPGWNIISSGSTPYFEANPDKAAESMECFQANGRDNHYINGGGTSMSSPYVAGAIACWLEANPSLKINDVQRIISETNVKDIPKPTDPHNGQGFFNPYKALQEVVRTSATNVDVISSDATRLSVGGNILTLWNPGRENKSVEIFSLDGRKILSAVTSEPIYEIDLTTLPEGFYIGRTSGASVKFRN